jgi:FkbH-like protein
MDFLDLKKNIKKDFTKFRVAKIALLGDSATQMLSQALKGYGYNLGINFEIYEAGHNQIEREILDPSSDMYNFKPEFIILFHSSQKLQHLFYQSNEAEKKLFAETHIKKVEKLYQYLCSKLSSRIIYYNFQEINDGIYGNYSNKTEMSFIYQIRKINFGLMNKAIELKNLFINDICALQSQYGSDLSYDPKLYINGDITFSIDFLPIVAKNTADIINTSTGKEKKCLILDLDNILWGGLIGDDGIEKIQIGHLGIGKAFSDFQYWIKQLKERGIILAVCSKNSESTAKIVFENHPEMILRLDDIAIFIANWNNKIDNIKHIQSVLNIGYDSMVFLDDTPFERNFVSSHFPEITVPELPEDPAEYLLYLQKLNLFETCSLTEEDLQRTKKYQEEANRSAAITNFSSADEFLENIDMVAEIKEFDPYTIPRVAQLIQRSNQFNLRTIRHSEEAIAEMGLSKDYFTFSISLSDKFGNYGLSAAVILKKETDCLFIDTWVMSCRVLKRGMEDLILNHIMNITSREGYNKIKGDYIATEKNMIVKDLYEDLGFYTEGDLWILKPEGSKARSHYIKIKN